MNTTSGISALHAAISNTSYKNIGYLIFLIVGIVINSNQTFIVYHDVLPELGSRIYPLCMILVLIYLSAIMLNMSVLIPRYFLKGHYTKYAILLIITVFMVPTLTVVEEYIARTYFDLPHRITNYLNPLILIDNLSTCLIVMICFIGMAAPVFIRKWIEQRDEVSNIENDHLRAQINKLKGQVSPDYLSLVLNSAAETVHTDHQSASDMLYRLSDILRYQLYEADNEKVNLISEVNFIRNYLELSAMCNRQFRFTFASEGDLSHYTVSPLIFAQILQSVIQNNILINILIAAVEETLHFSLASEEPFVISAAQIEAITAHLDYTYPSLWKATFSPGHIDIKINAYV